METRQQDFSFRLTGKGLMVFYLPSCDLDRWPSELPAEIPLLRHQGRGPHEGSLYINSSLDFCLSPPAALRFYLWMPHPKDFLFHAPAVCFTEMFQPGMPYHCPSWPWCFLPLLTNTLRVFLWRALLKDRLYLQLIYSVPPQWKGSHVDSFSHLSSVRAGTLAFAQLCTKRQLLVKLHASWVAHL